MIPLHIVLISSMAVAIVVVVAMVLAEGKDFFR